MSTENHKALIRRFVEEVWNRQNLSIVDELFAANHVFHAAGGPLLDREGHKQMIAHFESAFPDGRTTTEDMIAERDAVAQRWTYTGTHQGAFQGIPPTGKRVRLTGISIWRFEDGKIVQSWHDLDALGLMQQLSVIPAPGQA